MIVYKVFTGGFRSKIKVRESDGMVVEADGPLAGFVGRSFKTLKNKCQQRFGQVMCVVIDRRDSGVEEIPV